jgi:hypothetical protein
MVPKEVFDSLANVAVAMGKIIMEHTGDSEVRIPKDLTERVNGATLYTRLDNNGDIVFWIEERGETSILLPQGIRIPVPGV